VQVDAAVGLARDRRADGVADAQAEAARCPRELQRRERVGLCVPRAAGDLTADLPDLRRSERVSAVSPDCEMVISKAFSHLSAISRLLLGYLPAISRLSLG